MSNPVLALPDEDRPRFFDSKGKNYKRKMNLLKRAGEVRLVRLDAQSLTEPREGQARGERPEGQVIVSV